MANDRVKQILQVSIPIIAAVISIFVLARLASSTKFYANTIEALEEKQETVIELTAASTAASAAITLLPGDTATPIAGELAELSKYFMVVICAILLEKYLLTIIGYVTFAVLLPAACLIYSLNVFLKRDGLRLIVKKLLILGITIMAAVPGSILISDLVESTYEASIEQTMEAARRSAEEIENNTDATEEDGMLSDFLSKVQGGVSVVIEKFENLVSDFIEALAVLLITSCVIPVGALLFFVWLIKLILGVDIRLPRKKKNAEEQHPSVL